LSVERCFSFSSFSGTTRQSCSPIYTFWMQALFYSTNIGFVIATELIYFVVSALSEGIYLQIGEHLCDEIVNQKWRAGEKIPSVHEMTVRVEVNPNTVMRTYTDLEQKGILFNRRGIGLFCMR